MAVLKGNRALKWSTLAVLLLIAAPAQAGTVQLFIRYVDGVGDDAPTQGTCVIVAYFFEHINFGGQGFADCVSSCPTQANSFVLDVPTGWNDRISSVSPAGCSQVVLYQHSTFDPSWPGGSILCNAANSCANLVNRNFNDVTSSYKWYN